MVDGVSILGTAVGVTSLGIQVCQALVRYYSDFRGFGDDIAAVVTRAEGLEASLEALESIRPKIEVASSHVSKQLQHVIEACSKGLAELKAMVEKCGEVEIPVSAQEKRRLWKKRFLWPFREETLRNTRTKLDELQANVIIALQILDLDTGRQRFDVVRSSTDALILRSNKLEHSMLEQSKILDNVQEHLHRVTCGQEQEISQVSQLSLRLASIERQLTSLIARDTPPNPMGFSLINKQDGEIVHQPLVMKPKWQSHRKRCSCRIRKDVLWWKKFGTSFEINTIQETEHRPDCIFSQHGHSSYKLQAQFSRCTKLFGLCIQASIAVCKFSGWTSISPRLRMRRLVPKTSPAFAVFYHIRCTLKCWCGDLKSTLYCECGSRDAAPLILDDVLLSVRQYIEDRRASPYDTLINGDSILHMALRLVLQMIGVGDIDTNVAWNFLYSLISGGIFDHTADDIASTLVHEVFDQIYCIDDEMLQDKFAYISSQLISEFGPWSYKLILLERAPYCFMQQLLRDENVADLYDYQCPLVFAIHCKSKIDLIRELTVHESFSVTTNHPCKQSDICRNASRLILSSVHWPEGLHILLSSCLVRSANSVHVWDSLQFFDSIQYAAMTDDIQSLDLLAHFGWPVYPATWFFLWDIMAPITFLPQLLTAMLNWKALRPNIHTTKGTETFDCETMSFIYGVPVHVLWNSDLENLYHHPDLSVALANTLWEAGFKEVDNLDAFFILDCDVPCTPLWIQASELSSGNYFSWQWDVIEWLVEKGARLDWVQPVFRISPAHRIALRFGSQAHESPKHVGNSINGSSAECLLAKILPMDHLDECFCYYSMKGCYVIGCAAKMLSTSLLNGATRSSGDRVVLDVIAKAIDSTRHQPKTLGLAVIRVMTFNELSLTHTCCMPFSEPRSDDHDTEIRDIHQVEAKNMEIFEGLITEFESTWKGHQGTFHEYLEGVWKMRMKHSLDSKSDEPSTEDIERIERIGVILWKPFGPKEPQYEYLEHENDGLCHSIRLRQGLGQDKDIYGRRCYLED